MPRTRSPDRDRAYELWRASDGQKPLKDIAAQLGVSPGQVRKWKNQDSWDGKGNVTKQKSNVTKRPGAPKGNKNAAGNIGGPGGPAGNDKAVTHGFFRRIFPDDDETHAIIEAIGVMSPLDILWQNIVIQYTAIARAQRIMFVQDKQDETKVLKRTKESEIMSETEWEYQHAWDKQSNFLQAQSRAMKTLEGLISRYEEMLPGGLKVEEQRLKLEKMKAEIARINNPDGGDEDGTDDGFMDALEGKADEVWDDGEES